MTTPADITTALDSQLSVLEAMANTALNDLNAQTTRAQQILSDIEARVAAGQMGAELVPPLRDAIDAAKQTHSDISDQLVTIQDGMSTLQEAVSAMPSPITPQEI